MMPAMGKTYSCSPITGNYGNMGEGWGDQCEAVLFELKVLGEKLRAC